MDEIETYGVEIDSEVVSQDIDDVDFYAEREVENDNQTDILFE